DGPQVVHHALGVVDEVLGEVVAVLPGPGRLDLVVVAHEGGGELVGLAAEEAVEALEAPAQGPPGAGGSLVALLLGGEVPLADGPGGPAGVAQQLGEEGGRAGDAGVVAGEAGGQLGD